MEPQNTHKDQNASGFVSLVGAGPGDPGLMTLRGAECLAQADVVVYDRLANPVLLQMAPQAEWISAGKQPNHHPLPQDQINALLVSKAQDGKRVVRLKGGDPFVFGRGGEEALTLAEAGVRFEIVPGISSAIAVPAYAGISLTQRDIANSAALITGHRAEWIENPKEGWEAGSLGADTLIFLMGVKNLPRIVEQLVISGRPPETPAAVIHRGTSTRQKTVTGTLADIVEKTAEIRPPAIIVIGEVVRLRDRLRWYDRLENYPLFGLRVLNTKSIPISKNTLPHLTGIYGDEFSRQIYALGGEAIHLSAIRILPPPAPAAFRKAVERLCQLGAYDWVAFTSANAVRAFFEQMAALEVDSRALTSVKIAAVGQVTAQALGKFFICPDFVPTRFTGADLGEQLPIEAGNAILLPRSEFALPELPAILGERGGVVDEVIAYTVKTAPPDRSILDQMVDRQINVVTFFSPSGVRGLADMLAEASYTPTLPEILEPLTVACIGPTTAKTATDLGLRVDVVAQEYTAPGLVQALVKWRQHS